jgi:hypothetical protein
MSLSAKLGAASRPRMHISSYLIRYYARLVLRNHSTCNIKTARFNPSCYSRIRSSKDFEAQPLLVFDTILKRTTLSLWGTDIIQHTSFQCRSSIFRYWLCTRDLEPGRIFVYSYRWYSAVRTPWRYPVNNRGTWLEKLGAVGLYWSFDDPPHQSQSWQDLEETM